MQIFTSRPNMNQTHLGKAPRARASKSEGERRRRTVYSKEHVELLAKAFEAQPYPGYEAREHLASLTGIPEDRIHVWFQNRRARQLKPAHRMACAGEKKIPLSCRLPGQARQRGHLPAVPTQPYLDQPDLPSRSWCHLGHPQPLGQGEENPPFASQRSLLTTGHTSPFVQVWDAGIPLGQNLSSLPHQDQQQCYADDDEYPQWNLQNPPHYPYDETTTHFYGGLELSPNSNSPGLCGSGGSWENWE